jgi:hypothetical protein
MAVATGFRVGKDVAVAVAHQSAFGSAASPSGLPAKSKWQVESSMIDPGFSYEKPRGTTGSWRPKDDVVRTHYAPKATLTLISSPKVLPFIWEYALHGLSTSVQGSGDLAITGDPGAFLSALSLSGVRPGYNTDANAVIYGKVTHNNPGAGSSLVQLYSDSGRSILVAQGSGTNGTTIALTAQGGSLLTASVTLNATIGGDEAAIVITLSSVRPQEAGAVTRFFTLWRDHGPGAGLETLGDCVIEKLSRASEEKGLVKYTMEIVAATYAWDDTAGGTITPGLTAADKEYQLHAGMLLTADTAGTNAAQQVLKLDISIEHEIRVVIANASHPSALVKEMTKAYKIDWSERPTDQSQPVTERGISDTFEALLSSDSYASRVTSMTWARSKHLAAKFAKEADGEWDDMAASYEAFEDVSGNCLAVVIGL